MRQLFQPNPVVELHFRDSSGGSPQSDSSALRDERDLRSV
jgi:hypothetical protein